MPLRSGQEERDDAVSILVRDVVEIWLSEEGEYIKNGCGPVRRQNVQEGCGEDGA